MPTKSPFPVGADLRLFKIGDWVAVTNYRYFSIPSYFISEVLDTGAQVYRCSVPGIHASLWFWGMDLKPVKFPMSKVMRAIRGE